MVTNRLKQSTNTKVGGNCATFCCMSILQYNNVKDVVQLRKIVTTANVYALTAVMMCEEKLQKFNCITHQFIQRCK